MSFVWDRKSGKIEPAKTIKVAQSAIVVDLDQLKSLMLEFVAARGGDIDDDNLLRRLTLSDFLLWLRQKEQSNE